MKPTLLLGTLLLAGTTLHAQFSLLPYAGFEQSKNRLRNNSGLSAFNTAGNLKAGLQMGYRLKGGHSPFVNLTTSPAPVSFRFNNSGLLVNEEAIKGHLQFRMEAGYQWSSKPIQFGRKSAPSASSRYETTYRSYTQKRSCGSTTYRLRCGSKSKEIQQAKVSKNLNMRLQPSLALAYVPTQTENVKQTADGFEYTTGTWKTALVPAMGFEFGRGSQRLFTLKAFYTSPIGQKTETINTQIESKTMMTAIQPTTSTWGLTVGVPISFTKAKAPKTITRTIRKECSGGAYRNYRQMQ